MSAVQRLLILAVLAMAAIIPQQLAAAQADPAASWTVRQPGFVVETVASGFHLPVNIAFAHAGMQPTDPWFYVTELHGTVKVVRRDGTVQTFASGLLNFTPFDDSFEGAGEVGLAGIAVEPVSGDLFVSLAYGASGYLHPAVVRLQRSADGLTSLARTTVLSLSDVTISNSHMASRLSVGPDGKLYLHMGDAANPLLARDLTSFAGKILRMNQDGSAPRDNPFYDTTNGISASDYVYASGLRNPFGGDWREADGHLYVVDNGPSNDRLARITRGADLGYDGTDASMAIAALWNWAPPHAPVNLAFVQSTTFGGSGFPVGKQGHAFVSEFGSYWHSGPLATGKRISEFVFSSTGTRLAGPVPLIEYTGTGKASVVALAAGPDGLYFSDFFADQGTSPITVGANVLRVRWTAAEGAPTVTIDTANERQRITGIGGNFPVGRFTGSDTVNDEVGRLMLNRLKPTHARIGFPLKAWIPDPIDIDAPWQSFRDEGGVRNVFLLMRNLARRGIPVVVSVWDAPDWMVVNPTASEGRLLKTGVERDLVDSLTAMLVHARDCYGVQVQAVSFNEADGGYHVAIPVDRMARLIAQCGAAFRAQGLPTTWMASDAYAVGTAVPYALPVMTDVEARPYLGALAFHSWHAAGVGDSTFATIATLAGQQNLPVWCTELGHDHQAHLQSPLPFPTWDYGWGMARIAHRALAPGRAAVLHAWSYQNDFPLGDPQTGLYPAGYVMKQLADHLKPGSTMVESASNRSEIKALAAVHGPRNTIMTQLINTGTAPVRVAVNGLPDRRLKVQRTSASESMRRIGGRFQPSAGRLSIDLPAASITTISGTWRDGIANQPPVVDAGVDEAVAFGHPLSVIGSIDDDGQPDDGSLSSLWTVDSGPAPVVFGNPYAAETSVTFTAPGLYRLRLTASDGALSASDTVLMSVLGDTLRVNFQPALAPVPPGYVMDSGAPYGSRGNGFTYGWNVPLVEVRDRNSNRSPDQRFDTFAVIRPRDAAQARWEIAVPNGDYLVHLVAGDANADNDSHYLTAESIPVIAGVTTSASRWIAGTARVTVSDGRLTIGGSAGLRSKLCYVDITPATARPQVQFAVAASAIGEGAGSANIPVVLTNPTDQAVVVAVTVTGGTASSGTDFQPLASGTLTIPAGQTQGVVALTVIDDALREADETVVLTLSSPSYADLGAISTHTLTINDNDPSPQVGFAQTAMTVAENAGTVAVVVRLLAPSGLPASVMIGVSGGTASVGTDHQPVFSGAVTFAPGETQRTVEVVLIDDARHEPTETLVLTLSAASGATLSSATTCTLTISDDDQIPSVAFTAAATTVAQDAGAITLPFVLSAVSDVPAVVAWSVDGGTATIGTDVQIAAGQTTIAPGQTGTSIPATILASGAADDRTVVVTLSVVSGSTLGAIATHTVTISGVGEQIRPLASFATAASAIDESAGSASITITLDRPTTVPTTVGYRVAGGSATPGTDVLVADGTIVIAANATAGSGVLTIPVVGDDLVESDETLILELVESSTAALGTQATHTLTIRNDDLPAPVVAYSSGTLQRVQAFGLTPSGLGITALQIAIVEPASVISFTGSVVDGGLFHVEVDNATPAVPQVTFTIAFIDQHGRTGPATTKTIAFGNGAGGGVSDGDPDGLPPAPPGVSLVISQGLTGEQTGLIKGKNWHFTNEDEVTVTVTVDNSFGTIERVEVLTSWGQVEDATDGTADLQVPADGRYEITAIAVVSSSGQQASGETEEPTRLLKDSEPPSVRWLLPERYWPPGVEQTGDEEPEVPITLSPTDERQRLFLNASPVTQNQTLRLSRGMLVFDRAGFSLLGAIGDDSGLRKGGSRQKAGLLALGDLGITVTPEDPASDEPQRIEVTNFTKADGDQYTLRVTLEDRCGNKLENVAQALVTIDTQKPDDYLGLGLLPFQGSTPRPSSEYDYPASMTEMNPARYAATTARDVLALWQDSTVEDQALVGGGSFWQLKTPITLGATNGASGTASLRAMDVAGNLTGTLTLNASREVNMLMINEEGEHPVTSGLYYGPTFDEQPVLRDAPLTPRFDKMAWQKDGTTKEVEIKKTADEGIREVSATVDSSLVLQSINVKDWAGGSSEYTTIPVTPIDPGTDDGNRRLLPAVFTVTPSWETPARKVKLRVKDAALDIATDDGNPEGSIRLGGSIYVDANQATTTDELRGDAEIPRTVEGGFVRVGYNCSGYTNGYGFRWASLIKASPDVVASGTRVTVRIDAGFLNKDLILPDPTQEYDPANPGAKHFNPKGDYVRFVASGAGDVTETVTQYEQNQNNTNRPKNLISIVAQRLRSDGKHGAERQTLELDLELGSEVQAALHHIDVKLGAVKGIAAGLGAEHVGANGGHRMKEALAVVKLGVEDKQEEPVGALASVSDPHPQVKLDQVSAGDVQRLPSGLMQITLTGYVYDALADITPGGAADIREVDIAGSTVAVTKVADDRDENERLRPFGWRGKFTTPVIFPATKAVDISVKAVNALGNEGYDSIQIAMDLDVAVHGVVPNVGLPAVVIVPGCRLPDAFDSSKGDRMTLIDGTTGVVLGGGDESQNSSRIFPGVLLARAVSVRFDDPPAVLSVTERDALTMRITLPDQGAEELVIFLVETDLDSREFRPDPLAPVQGVITFPAIAAAPAGVTNYDTTVNVTNVQVVNQDDVVEGLVSPLVITLEQPAAIPANGRVPWDTLTVDGRTLEVVEDGDDLHRRAKLPLLLVKRPVPPELAVNGNVIEAKALAGSIDWDRRFGRLLGMAYVAADPKDVALYGRGLEWPCIVKAVNVDLKSLISSGDNPLDVSAQHWKVRMSASNNGGAQIRGETKLDIKASYRRMYNPWFGSPRPVYDVTLTSVLDARQAEVASRNRDIEVLYDNKLVGEAYEQIQIVPTRVVLFCIDGLGSHWFSRAAEQAPVLRSLMGQAEGFGDQTTYKKGSLRTAVSALPSITWCNWASVLTGTDPKDHGVYGNSFFRRDKPKLLPIFSGNDLAEDVGGGGDLLQFGESVPVPMRATQQGLGFLLRENDTLKTLFEEADDKHDATSASILTWYGRGANHETHFMWSFMGRQMIRLVRWAGQSVIAATPENDNPGGALSGVFVGMANEYRALRGHETDGSSALFADLNAMDQAVSAYTWGRKPIVTAIYLPGPDNYGHAVGEDDGYSGDEHNTIIGNKTPLVHFTKHHGTDYQIGRIRDRIAHAGLQNATVYVFTSDHGQTVNNHTGDANHSADSDLELRWQEGQNRQVIEVIEAARPGIVGETFLAKDDDDHLESSIIYSPNGGLAYIYARAPTPGEPSDGSRWSTPDNTLVRDLAIELWRQSHGESPLFRDPSLPPLEYDFTGALGHDPVVLVRQTSAFVGLDGSPYPTTYAIMALTNVNIIDANDIRCELSSLETIAARHGDWVDFPRRIRALDDMKNGNPSGTRCGDIILVPDTKAGFNAVHEGDAYPGWHGGPSQADSKVPLAVASEALAVDGSSNQWLRDVVGNSQATGTSVIQNQDATRVVLKILEKVK